MRKTVIGTAAALILCVPAVCRATDCKSLTDPQARLACYDSNGAEASSPPAKAAPHFPKSERESGAWSVIINQDNFTNENTVVVATEQEDNAIALRCFSHDPSFAVGVEDERPAPGDEFTFKMRVDSGPIHDASGEAINDKAAQATVDDGIIQEMVDGNTLAIRIITASGTSRDESFSLAGIGAALKEFRQLCPS